MSETRKTTTGYYVMVSEDTVLLVTQFSSGERAEIALDIDQAKHLAFRLNEAVAFAPQVGAAN